MNDSSFQIAIGPKQSAGVSSSKSLCPVGAAHDHKSQLAVCVTDVLRHAALHVEGDKGEHMIHILMGR